MRALLLVMLLASGVAADVPRRAGAPIGGVDGASFERISGWAYDPAQAVAEVRLEIAGQLTRVQADRPSTAHPELGELAHGFEVRLGVDAPMPADLAAVPVRVFVGERLVYDETCDLRYPARAGDGAPHRVMLVVIDPPVISEGFKRLHEVLGLRDPRVATQELMTEIEKLSGGRVSYTVTRVVEPGRWPGEFFGSEEAERAYLAVCRAAAAARPQRDAGRLDDAAYRARLTGSRVVALPMPSIVRQVWSWNRFFGKNEPVEEVWVWRPPFTSLPAFTQVGAAEQLEQPVAIVSFALAEPVSEALHVYAHRTRALTGPVGEGVDAACNGDLTADEGEHELPELSAPRADATSIRFAEGATRASWGGVDDLGGHARWWLSRLGEDAWRRAATAGGAR